MGGVKQSWILDRQCAGRLEPNAGVTQRPFDSVRDVMQVNGYRNAKTKDVSNGFAGLPPGLPPRDAKVDGRCETILDFGPTMRWTSRTKCRGYPATPDSVRDVMQVNGYRNVKTKDVSNGFAGLPPGSPPRDAKVDGTCRIFLKSQFENAER